MTNTSASAKEAHVEKIITDSLDVVEKEHGLWGLDHVYKMLKTRRESLIQQGMREREIVGVSK